MSNKTNRLSEAVYQSPVLSKGEAAQYLGCTDRFIEKLVKQGKLRQCKVSNKFVRLLRSDIDQMLEKSASFVA